MMKKIYFPFFLLFIALWSCVDTGQKQEDSGISEVSIVTNVMDIVMDDTIETGYHRFVYENKSDMAHLLLFNQVPDSIDKKRYLAELTRPFQAVYDSIAAGGEPKYDNFPAWLAGMVNYGGIGLLSGGATAETIMNLPPGNYVAECYIKTEGVFHSATGMLHQFTVIEAAQDSIDMPMADMRIHLSTKGMTVEGDAGQAGEKLFKVTFGDRETYPNFTARDVQVARLTENTDVDSLLGYMDWALPAGMIMHAPVSFLGGVQEMPEGSLAWFRQDLSAGTYALIGEVPKPKEMGFYYEFEVK